MPISNGTTYQVCGEGSGKPTVFKQHIVQQSLMKRIGQLPPNGVDFISVGALTHSPQVLDLGLDIDIV